MMDVGRSEDVWQRRRVMMRYVQVRVRGERSQASTFRGPCRRKVQESGYEKGEGPRVVSAHRRCRRGDWIPICQSQWRERSEEKQSGERSDECDKYCTERVQRAHVVYEKITAIAGECEMPTS